MLHISIALHLMELLLSYDNHAFEFRILSWQVSQGVQSIPENSLQYANENALLLAKVLVNNYLRFWCDQG